MDRDYENVDAAPTDISEPARQKLTGEKPCRLVPSKPTKERVYDTSHASIGEVIILNQEEFDNGFSKRDGSQNDVVALTTLLTALCFKVITHDNKSVSEINSIIEKAAEQDYTNVSCLMIFVLTHGHEKGRLYARDRGFEVEDLYKPFLRCSSLNGKPKLFFLQACRGNFTDVGVIAKATHDNRLIDSTDAKEQLVDYYSIPTYADMLVMYSTIEGVVSFRNPEGSWFIQALCKEIGENSHEDLLTILTYVNNHVAYSKESCNRDMKLDLLKQMTVVKFTLTKKFFFKKMAANGETSKPDEMKCAACGR